MSHKANHNQQDATIATWLTWKLSTHKKSYHEDTYHQDLKDPILWNTLLETLGVSGLEKSTNSDLAVIVQLIQKQGIELQTEYFVQSIGSGNKDAIRDILITLLLHCTEAKTLESQVSEIVCEPPYNLQRSDLTDIVTSSAICNGKALCALVHSKAMVFNFRDATEKPSKELISLVLDIAEKKLGIPQLFSAEDLANKSVDILPIALFVSSVLKHKGLSFAMPAFKSSRLSAVSVNAGGAALKKFQDQNLAEEIKKLKEQIQTVKKNNEQEINATKAALTENLKNAEKGFLEETRTVKKKIDDVGAARDAELKEARAKVSSNEQELKKIASDRDQYKEQLAQYENKLEDLQMSLKLAIDKKRRERAKNVQENIESTLNTVRNNYQDIQKKLKQIENLKSQLLDKSKSLEQQRADYAKRRSELQDLTDFITNRINFLANQLEKEKKAQSELNKTVNLTQLQMQIKSQEELKILRQQEDELRKLKQRMDSEQRKIEAAEQHAEQLFMENDFENEKTKGDDIEPDFDRADKELLETELEGYMARRQICLATLEIVKQQEAELDRSHKEVLSELDELDREERQVIRQLEIKPPQEKVAPEMGALVMVDDEISILKMQTANLGYDMQELESELEHLKVEKWNVKTHLGQVIAQLVILEMDIQVLRDMEIVTPEQLKAMVADVAEKIDVCSHEKSRLKQWRNYYFGKYKKTSSQLVAAGKKDIVQAQQDQDADMEDDEISDNGSIASNSSSFNDSKSSPVVSRKDKRASWNFSLKSKDKAAFSQSMDGKLAPPEDKKSRRKSITGAFAKLFS